MHKSFTIGFVKQANKLGTLARLAGGLGLAGAGAAAGYSMLPEEQKAMLQSKLTGALDAAKEMSPVKLLRQKVTAPEQGGGEWPMVTDVVPPMARPHSPWPMVTDVVPPAAAQSPGIWDRIKSRLAEGAGAGSPGQGAPEA